MMSLSENKVPGSQSPAAWLEQIFPKDLKDRMVTGSGDSVAKELILQKKGDELSFVEKGKQWKWSEVGHKETWVGVWKRITRMWNQAVHGVSYDFKANLRELDERIETAYQSIGTMNKELSDKLFYLSKVHDGLLKLESASANRESIAAPITPERVKKICSLIAGEWGRFVLSSSHTSTETDPLNHLIECLSGTDKRKSLEGTYEDVKERLTKLSEKPDSLDVARRIQEVLNGDSNELPETRLAEAQKMLTKAESQEKCRHAAEDLKTAAGKLKGKNLLLDNQIDRLLNVVENIDSRDGNALERLTNLQTRLETVIRPFHELNSQINARIEELNLVSEAGPLSKEKAAEMIANLERVRSSFQYENPGQISAAQRAVGEALEANKHTQVLQHVDGLRKICTSEALARLESRRSAWFDSKAFFTLEPSLHELLRLLALKDHIAHLKNGEGLSEGEISKVMRLLKKALPLAEAIMVARAKRAIAEYSLLAETCTKTEPAVEFTEGLVQEILLLLNNEDHKNGWSSEQAHELIDELNKIVQDSEALKKILSQSISSLADGVLKALKQLKEEQEKYDALKPLTAFVDSSGSRVELSESEREGFEKMKKVFEGGCSSLYDVMKENPSPDAIDRKMERLRADNKNLLDGMKVGFTRVLEERNKTIPEEKRKTLDELLKLNAQEIREYFSQMARR